MEDSKQYKVSGGSMRAWEYSTPAQGPYALCYHLDGWKGDGRNATALPCHHDARRASKDNSVAVYLARRF